jgi:hypothetical protein
MRYDLEVVRNGERSETHECLSYETFVEIICDDILSDRFEVTVIKRRCCGSVCERFLTIDDAQAILDLVRKEQTDDPKTILKRAVSNWYMKGTISADSSDLPDML